MRAYCQVHKESFSVAMLSPVVCERGKHALGNAPDAVDEHDLWEYCCECQSFWLATGTSSSKCPVCDREAAARYLCDNCQTLTVQATSASIVREFFISPHGTPQPNCPACKRTPRKPVVTHKCTVYGASFSSARANCPFCRAQIVAQPEPKPAPAPPAQQPPPAPKPNPQFPFRLKHVLILSAAMLVLIPSLALFAFFAIRADSSTTPLASGPRAPAGMAFVSGGTFIMGDDAGDEYERPAHSVTVQPFFIDVNEVTCSDYAKFLRETHRRPSPRDWDGDSFPSGTGGLPVTGIDWYDAQAYAAWAGKRLPTEQEWEFAARGTDARRYTWGDVWQSRAANAGETSAGRLVTVGLYPDGKSPFGVLDMIGNAWEWTSTDLRPYPGAKIADFPVGPRKIIRGGSWAQDNPPDWTTTFRGFALPSGGRDYSKIGFRCAKDAPQNYSVAEKGK